MLDEGKVIKTDPLTQDIMVADLYLKEISKISGKGISQSFRTLLSTPAGLYRRSISQPSSATGSLTKMLWLDSGSTLQTVDLATMKSSEIANFWNYIETKCLALFATCSSDFKRFAGIGLTPTGQQTLHVYDIAGGTGFSSASIGQLFQSKLR